MDKSPRKLVHYRYLSVFKDHIPLFEIKDVAPFCLVSLKKKFFIIRTDNSIHVNCN